MGVSQRSSRRVLGVVAVGWLALGVPGVWALEWPQEITAPEGRVVLYQPQPEKLAGNLLTGRAAFSLDLPDHGDLLFGAMWFSAQIDTDRNRGIANVRNFNVTKVRWPDSTEAQEQRFTQIVEAAAGKAVFEISLERLSASLATADLERKSLEDLNNDPPEIVFRQELAVLLLYDGEPYFAEVDNGNYERAINTPLVVVRDKKAKALFLSSGSLWYRAGEPLGPWSPTDSPPADLVKMLPAPDPDVPPPKTPPEIVVATKPTELICTAGTPSWKSLPTGELLYVENTETPWIRELSSGAMYVLLSGRWYTAKSEDGPWTFVRPDALPASFKQIPPKSDIGGVRVSVPGTEEADDAMLDAAVPQTAAIERSKAKLEVKYNGKPEFEKISGTVVSYAVNTEAQVLEIEGSYYAVDNGVWFTSASAEGPWVVADSVPEEEINKIPPSSPVYNTTYVQVYESTPDVVYVGYTPGYLWSFPYYGVPVYGTGWYYPPYWGGAYYPRPSTWGFHVGYNPWTGWSFGLSWSCGFFSFGVSWGGGYPPYYGGGCCGGWYGGGYHGPININTGDINIGNSVNIGNNRDKISHMDRPSQGNLYDRPTNRDRNASPTVATRELQQAREARGLKNDVYVDKDGNVARRKGDNWETRDNGEWKREPKASPNPGGRGTTGQPDRAKPTPSNRASGGASQLDRAGLDRAYDARRSGASRERAAPRPSAPRRMPSRGGGRR